MTARDEFVRVPRALLESIRESLTAALDALDEVARRRADVAMMRIRVSNLLLEETEKTPVRSVSTDSMQAYKASADFDPTKA